MNIHFSCPEKAIIPVEEGHANNYNTSYLKILHIAFRFKSLTADVKLLFMRFMPIRNHRFEK